MPGRSRSVTVSERPNTSSGPDSRKFSDKPNFDKRVSRDDLALILKSSSKGNLKSYHIPIRGRLPSPATSPRSRSPAHVTTVRTSTPESMGETRNTEVVAIGMALGSPSHPPEHTAIRQAPQMHQQPRSQPEMQPEAPPKSNVTEKAPEEAPKTRARKWSIFGRSKSKRGRNAEPPVPQRSMTDESNASKTSITPSTPSSSHVQRKDSHGTLESKKTPKHKPIVIKTDNPLVIDRIEFQELKTPLASKDPSRRSYSRHVRGESKSKQTERLETSPIPPVPQLNGSLLDVEIPSIKMERYSVMFGSLLQPQPAASLLARRQATLDRLKSIDDERAQASLESQEQLPIPRRASSPQPKDSPTFSLFPPTPGATRLGASQRPSHRSRSNTSPAMLHSPARESFDVPLPPNHQHQTSASRSRTGSEDKNSEEHTPSSATRTHAPLISKFNKKPSFASDKSSHILESPIKSDDEHSEVHIKERLRPAFVEPTWEMITPPPSTASSSAPSVSKKSTPPPSLASSDHTTTTKPSEEDPEEALMNAVQISIARQISVSHQQRKMLRPLQSHPSLSKHHPKPAGPLNSNPTDDISMGMHQTKSAVPTLVVPDETTDSPKMAFRKSERVIVEEP